MNHFVLPTISLRNTKTQFALILILSVLFSGVVVAINSPFAVMALMAAASFLLICFARPMAAFFFYVFMLLHEQIIGLKIANVMVVNLMLFCVVSGCILSSISAGDISGLVNSVKRSVLICLVFIGSLLLVSLFNTTATYSAVVFYCFRLLALFSLFYHFVDSLERLYLALKIMLFSGLCMALFGLFEVVIGRTFFYSAWTLGERYRLGIVRMGSTVGDPNYVCLALLPLIPLAHYFYISAKTKLEKIYYSSTLVLLALTTLLTFSRIGCLVLFMYFAYSFFEKCTRSIKLHFVVKQLIVISIIGVISTIAFYGYFFLSDLFSGAHISSSTRSKALEVSFHYFKKFPFCGVGFDRLEYLNGFYLKSNLSASGGLSSMNTYLKILAEDGIFVLTAFLGVIVYALIRLQKLAGSDPVYHHIKLGFSSWLLIAVTLDSMGTAVFWVFIAAVMRSFSLHPITHKMASYPLQNTESI